MRKKCAAYLAIELALLCVLVPSPALRFDGRPITVYGVCTAAAALLCVMVFEKLRIAQVKRSFPKDGPVGVIFRVDALELALFCIPAALLGARALYVALRPGYYFFDAGLLHALYVWEGGFLLWGAVFGVMLAAAWMAKSRNDDRRKLLDQMAVPGMLAIALCRLAENSAGEGLGPWIENPVFAGFPFAVCNIYGEWQMAVFLLEALASLLIMAALLRIPIGRGERMEAALTLYACAQVVFESLRMDSCLRIGFVRVSQVISVLVILWVTGMRAYRADGRKHVCRRCAAILICAALIGGMEWALDKTQVHNALIYGAMALVCSFMAVQALCKRKDISL